MFCFWTQTSLTFIRWLFCKVHFLTLQFKMLHHHVTEFHPNAQHSALVVGAGNFYTFYSKHYPKLLNQCRGHQYFSQAQTSLPTTTDQQCKNQIARMPSGRKKGLKKKDLSVQKDGFLILTPTSSSSEEHLPSFDCDPHTKCAFTLLYYCNN